MGALWEDFFLLAIVSQFSEHEQLYKINPQNGPCSVDERPKFRKQTKQGFHLSPSAFASTCDFVIRLRSRIKIDIHPKYLRQTGSILLGFSEVF